MHNPKYMGIMYTKAMNTIIKKAKGNIKKNKTKKANKRT